MEKLPNKKYIIIVYITNSFQNKNWKKMYILGVPLFAIKEVLIGCFDFRIGGIVAKD